MKYCTFDGTRYPNEMSSCRACGRTLVDASEVGNLPEDVAANLTALCCPARGCPVVVAPAKMKYCGNCGAKLEPISYNLWADKFVGPALGESPVKVLLDPSDVLRPLAEMGLSREQGRARLRQAFCEKVGVGLAEFETWMDETTSLFGSGGEPEALRLQARRRAADLKIPEPHAAEIVERLSRDIVARPAPPPADLHPVSPPTPEAVTAGQAPSRVAARIYKLRKREPPEQGPEGASGDDHGGGSRERAQALYRNLIQGKDVSVNPTYLSLDDAEWGAPPDGGSPILREGQRGPFVLFPSAEDDGWLFPNPKLRFSPQVLKQVFPDLTKKHFEHSKADIQPVLVSRLREGSWKVAAERALFAPQGRAHTTAADDFTLPGGAATDDAAAKDVATARAGDVLAEGPSSPWQSPRPDAAAVTQAAPQPKNGANIVVQDEAERMPAAASERPSSEAVARQSVLNLEDVAAAKGANAPRRRTLFVALVVAAVVALALAAVLWPRPSVNTDNSVGPPATPSPTAAGQLTTGGEMILLKGGEFLMGREGSNDPFEQPPHKVTLPPFFIDAFEVTCEQYARFVKERRHAAPPGWVNGEFPTGTARRPVTGVTWDDAVAYAEWAGKRLPTEEEWEFAARGSEGRLYPWGNAWLNGAANVGRGINVGPSDVGTYKAGATPEGVYDLIGNVWEWTASDLKPYPGGQLPPTPAGDMKVIRGGSWREDTSITGTYRGYLQARGGRSYRWTGFRCARDAPPDTRRQ